MTTNPPAADLGLAERRARHVNAIKGLFDERFVSTFQSPVLVLEDQTLASPVAIRFFHKDFGYLSKQLYMEYQYRSWYGFNTELLDRFANLGSAKLQNIQTLLGNWDSRLKKILEQAGKHRDEALSLYPQTLKVDVPIIAAQARVYLEMLMLMDRIYILSGSANLWGLLDSQQRAQVEWTCKKALRAFRATMEQEVFKLYREAQRLQREKHSKGEADPERDRLLAEQGKEIEKFSKESQNEALQDGDTLMTGDDASQMLAEAAATSIAAAGAPARKTARKKPAADAPAPPNATTAPTGEPAPAGALNS
jgi:hypothetical protein